jgi:hypothetical protein
MLLRRGLCAALVLIFAGLFASAALSAAELSVGFYLKQPEVHNYQLTEEKLQSFDRVSRRVFSLKRSDPIVKALSQKAPPNAPISQLVQMLEATPLKPLIESEGLTIRDWLIMEWLLKATPAAYNYYAATGKYPGATVSMENVTFYSQHRTEIEKMVTAWSKLRAEQIQQGQPPRVPAPKNN